MVIALVVDVRFTNRSKVQPLPATVENTVVARVFLSLKSSMNLAYCDTQRSFTKIR